VVREFGFFPTTLANLLTPILGLSVSVEARPRPGGDFERRIEEITGQLRQSGSDAQALLVERRV